MFLYELVDELHSRVPPEKRVKIDAASINMAFEVDDLQDLSGYTKNWKKIVAAVIKYILTLFYLDMHIDISV